MKPKARRASGLQLLRSPARTRLAAAEREPPALPRDLDSLYRRYAGYVAAIAARLLGRDGELEDLVQDVFLDVMRGIEGLREPEAFKSWLARITVRKATSRLRQHNLRRALHLEGAYEKYEELAASGASPEQRALISQVYRVLDAMPAKTRVIWVLRHVLDEPLHSVAALAECSQSTVQRRLLEAEAQLARELAHE